jgi:mono/diheme cytochrome c family protein
MIHARMRRPIKLLLLLGAALAVTIVTAACGTQHINVDKADYAGALIFSQRCAGCHTLSYAGTHGSASNVRSAQPNNGPNFNVRCERPAARVLYAIENGGFSGSIMPQNVVVGQDARQVAEFVATYAGRQAPSIPGVPICTTKSVQPLEPPATAIAATTTPATTTAAATTAKKTKRK